MKHGTRSTDKPLDRNRSDLSHSKPARESANIVSPAGRWDGGTLVGWSVIALVFATGFWIRWKIATGELLWLDELHTGWVVSGSFEQVLTRSAQGNQAPLFFGLVWSAIQWLGTSELSLRLVSLLAAMLAMVMAVRFVWLQTKSIAAATLTLTLIAIDDSFVRYATEARPYVLLHLASVVQAACFWRSLQRWRKLSPDDQATDSNHWLSTIGLLLSSWLVVYTHYTGVFLLAAEVLFLLPLLLGRYLTGNAIKEISVTIVLFTVGCLPLLLQMNQAFGRPSDWSLIAELPQFQAEQAVNGIRWFGIPLVAVALSTAIALLLKRRFPVVENQTDSWLSIWWVSWIAAWFLIPLLIITRLHLYGIPIALSRYLSVGVIAGPIFAGAIVGTCRAHSRWIAIPLILLASVYAHWQGQFQLSSTLPRLQLSYRVIGSIVQDGQLPLLRSENWQAPIEVINNSADKTKWPLFLFGAVIEDANALVDTDPEFQSYLQFPVRSLYAVDDTGRIVFAGPTIQQPHFDDRHLNVVLERGGAWILVRHRPQITQEIGNELERRIRSQLDDPNATIELNWFGNNENLVHLISIEIK